MEKNTLKMQRIIRIPNIYSCLETYVGQSFNIYWNVVHFFNTIIN